MTNAQGNRNAINVRTVNQLNEKVKELEKQIIEVNKLLVEEQEKVKELEKERDTMVSFMYTKDSNKHNNENAGLGSNKDLKKTLKPIMDEQIMPIIKFASHERIISLGEKTISNIVMQHIVPNPLKDYGSQIKFWTRAAPIVKKLMAEYRSNVTARLKKKIIKGMVNMSLLVVHL